MKTEKKTLSFKERLADIKKKAAEKPKPANIESILDSLGIEDMPERIQVARREFDRAFDRVYERSIEAQRVRPITPYVAIYPNISYRENPINIQPYVNTFNPTIEEALYRSGLIRVHRPEDFTPDRNHVGLYLNINEEPSGLNGERCIRVEADVRGERLMFTSRSFSQNYGTENLNNSVRAVEMANVLRLLGNSIIDRFNMGQSINAFNANPTINEPSSYPSPLDPPF